MKKVCVFGADGRTGRFVVEELVRRGNFTTAFSYEGNLEVEFPDAVRVVKGDVLHKKSVDEALLGVDAVISVIGHVKNSNILMQTKGMQNIVDSMRKRGIKRVVSLTGTGVREKKDEPSLMDRVLNLAVLFFDRPRVLDGIKHVEILKSSNLDWTVLRVLKLTNSDRKDVRYDLTLGGPSELSTSRKKVASILVDLACSNDFVHELPVSSPIK